MAESISVFCCGALFGAALYITLAQHPAALEVGPSFAGRFFARVYRRAAAMQVALAISGTLAGVWAWWQGSRRGRDPEAPDTEGLLRRWGSLHAVRTALSGLAFVLLIEALTFG